MAAGSEQDQRENLATVVQGRAGAPTPSERREVYLEQLRKGPLPPGWMSKKAREWGIHRNSVIIEVAGVKEALNATRTPDAAATQAHELIQQTIDAAGEIDKDAGEIDDPEKRARTRAIAATLKLKAADALRNLYRKNSGLASEVAELMTRKPGGLSADDLKG